MPDSDGIRHPIPIECEQSVHKFLLFPNEKMVGKRRLTREPLPYLVGNTRATKEITFPATTSNLSFVAIPSDLLRADETKRLYRGMINRSRYFGMSTWFSLTLTSKTRDRVRSRECAYAAAGSVSSASPARENRMSSFAETRITRVSNKAGCIHNLASSWITRLYFEISIGESREGASSGRAMNKSGRVPSVMCRGDAAEIDVSNLMWASLDRYQL